MGDVPGAPAALGEAGRALWQSIADEYELEPHNLAVLEQAARVADHVALLDEAVRRDGVLMENPQRGTVAHPALVELRQQRLTLTRLLVALRLPDEDDGKPQHRGLRGVYHLRGTGAPA